MRPSSKPHPKSTRKFTRPYEEAVFRDIESHRSRHDILHQDISMDVVPADRTLLPLYADLLQLRHRSHPETWSAQGRMAHLEAHPVVQPLGRKWL